MFNSKKQTNPADDSKEGKQKIELEMKTMKNDLKNLPSQKKSFFVKNNSEQKPKSPDKNPSASPFSEKSSPEKTPPFKPKNQGPLSSQFLPEKELPKKETLPVNFQSEDPAINRSEFERGQKKKKVSLDNYSNQKNTFPRTSKINPLSKEDSPKIPTKKAMKNTKKLNWKLLAIAIVVFVFALGSGAYYYFSTTGTNEGSTLSTLSLNESKPIEITEPIPEEKPIEITTPEIEVEIETSNLPSILNETEMIELATEQNLKEVLANFNLKANQELISGAFYEVSKSGEILTAQQILQELEINIPDINDASKKGWLYIESNDLGGTKKALIVESGLSFVEIKNAIMPIEKSLPSSLKNLYSPVLVMTKEEVVFQTSEIDESFRYFNIEEGNPARSTDWGIIGISKDSEENNLIIFSTSKTTTEKIVISF